MVETNLPVIFLRDVVILPYNELRIELSTPLEKSILKISEHNHDNHLLFINLDDSLEEKPSIRKLPKIGILGKIKTKLELPNGIVRLVVTGLDRVEVLSYVLNDDDSYEAFVIPTKDYDYDELEAIALKRILLKDLNDYIEISASISNNVLGRISGVNSLSRLSDIIVFELPFEYNTKVKYIEISNPISRIKNIIRDLNREMETVKLENRIDDDLKERLDEELNRYEFTSPTSPEMSIIRNYIDWLASLPWNKSTKDNKDIKDIREKLDGTHFGLNSVKDRIVEYIAVSKIKKKNKSPILCLIGPPGVGKTTMAKSIAKALNKKFVKISVGGVHDEGEIVGHRRTYIGACPGRIIQGLKRVGVNNPVFLIDEIDKLTKDYKGDPASALLDVLDKEQNSGFIDNYIEEEVDLSNVLFILTGNDEDKIPDALKDRLEIINLSSYTLHEKEDIALNYIIPKLSQNYDISLNLSSNDIKEIIIHYTRESGVRQLERCIDTIFRKILVDGKAKEKASITDYLGNYKYRTVLNEKDSYIGVINALGYTPYGGCIQKVSVLSYPGVGEVHLTGMLGDVLKESAMVAVSFIKANSTLMEIDSKVFKNNDFHIHFEGAAVQKDGPSAGLAVMTSLISLLKKKEIDTTVSMTGEITLRGKVLPVGGVKEKVLAAINNNVKLIYVPIDNKEDVREIPSELLKGIKIKYINNYLELYNDLF